MPQRNAGQVVQDSNTTSDDQVRVSVIHPLKSIPTELLQTILSSAPNAFALRALALTNSRFYYAFKSHERSIIETVLNNEFNSGILPEALATWTSASQSSWLGRDREGIQKLLSKEIRPSNLSIPDLWTFENSLALSRSYSDVAFFARDFASGLSGNPVTKDADGSSIVLTALERNRIERAFYWFELYCNIFRTSHFTAHQRQDLFVKSFAPWEIEQLTSVFEYLYRQVSIPFTDVAKHDVQWGEDMISWDDGMDSHRQHSYKEHLMSLGLSYLRRVVSASTYEERYRMIAAEHKSYRDFLMETLCEVHDAYEDIPLEDLTEEEQPLYFTKPMVKDPDSGPAEAWRWAFHDQKTGDIYASHYTRELRQRGYVMFDHHRLCEWDIFREPFDLDDEDTIERRERLLREHVLHAQHYEEMEESWEKRSKIWQKGGRGYWSEEDQSRLEWPYRVAQKPKPKLFLRDAFTMEQSNREKLFRILNGEIW